MPSLADQAVATLAAVSAMDEGVTNEHPMRHQIRTLKRLAESEISNALRHAHELTYMAAELGREEQPHA